MVSYRSVHARVAIKSAALAPRDDADLNNRPVACLDHWTARIALAGIDVVAKIVYPRSANHVRADAAVVIASVATVRIDQIDRPFHQEVSAVAIVRGCTPPCYDSRTAARVEAVVPCKRHSCQGDRLDVGNRAIQLDERNVVRHAYRIVVILVDDDFAGRSPLVNIRTRFSVRPTVFLLPKVDAYQTDWPCFVLDAVRCSQDVIRRDQATATSHDDRGYVRVLAVGGLRPADNPVLVIAVSCCSRGLCPRGLAALAADALLCNVAVRFVVGAVVGKHWAAFVRRPGRRRPRVKARALRELGAALFLRAPCRVVTRKSVLFDGVGSLRALKR